MQARKAANYAICRPTRLTLATQAIANQNIGTGRAHLPQKDSRGYVENAF